MTQFHAEILTRVHDAMTSLDQALQEGDDHMVDVRVGELESLAHLAGEHGVVLPELAAYRPTVADAS